LWTSRVSRIGGGSPPRAHAAQAILVQLDVVRRAPGGGRVAFQLLARVAAHLAEGAVDELEAAVGRSTTRPTAVSSKTSRMISASTRSGWAVAAIGQRSWSDDAPWDKARASVSPNDVPSLFESSS
jgi:hypothetical protein